MRRKVGGVEYARLRDGLLQCRDQKDQCMDELEDIKESENMDVETYISKIEDMTKVLLEHQDALPEAFNKMKVAAANQAKKELVPDQAEAGPLGCQTEHETKNACSLIVKLLKGCFLCHFVVVSSCNLGRFAWISSGLF